MTHVDMSWIHDTKRRRVYTSGDGVPEGIFYPQDDDLSHLDYEKYKEWQSRALEAGRFAWRSIGSRLVHLARKGLNQTQHAIRTKPRGYGSKRRHWAATTECGQIMYQQQGWQVKDGPLGDTSCLACRKVVRQRWEMDQLDGAGADDLLDEYDATQIGGEWWAVQAEWHKPDSRFEQQEVAAFTYE